MLAEKQRLDAVGAATGVGSLSTSSHSSSTTLPSSHEAAPSSTRAIVASTERVVLSGDALARLRATRRSAAQRVVRAMLWHRRRAQARVINERLTCALANEDDATIVDEQAVHGDADDDYELLSEFDGDDAFDGDDDDDDSIEGHALRELREPDDTASAWRVDVSQAALYAWRAEGLCLDSTSVFFFFFLFCEQSKH